jgi:predicted RNA-binding Zn ribbon-like protein
MTGERQQVVIAGLDAGILMRERDLPQPGGREPAPGDLVLVQSFLNSHFDLTAEWGTDLLGDPERVRQWLSKRGWSAPGARAPSRSQVRRVIAVREGLRALAHRNRGTDGIDPEALARLNEVAADVSIGLALGRERVALAAHGKDTVETALAVLLAIAVRSMIDGRWQRVKACPGTHCGWVFYDYSRNNSSRWCSMAVCGGRAKARAHYRRRQGDTTGNGG